MAKQASNPASGELSATSAVQTQSWPKVVAAPAVWESSAPSGRMNRLASPFRSRRLTVDPVQRATLW